MPSGSSYKSMHLQEREDDIIASQKRKLKGRRCPGAWGGEHRE